MANDVATSNTKSPVSGEYSLLKNQILFLCVNLDLPIYGYWFVCLYHIILLNIGHSIIYSCVACFTHCWLNFCLLLSWVSFFCVWPQLTPRSNRARESCYVCFRAILWNLFMLKLLDSSWHICNKQMYLVKCYFTKPKYCVQFCIFSFNKLFFPSFLGLCPCPS